MASRWMQQVNQRRRSHTRRLGNLSMDGYQRFLVSEGPHGEPRKTLTVEQRFYRPKMNESIDHHIERMMGEAEEERLRPTAWYRHLARVLQVIEGPLDAVEMKLIRNAEEMGYTVEETEKSILRYRRITNRDPKKEANPKHVIQMNIGKPEEPPKQKRQPKPKVTGGWFNPNAMKVGFTFGKKD